MAAYLIRRILLSIPVLFLVTIIVFALLRFIPGDVIDAMLAEAGQGGGGGAQVEIDRAALEHALGLDVPIHVQYGRWVSGVLRGDLGTSLRKQRPVRDLIFGRLPVTMELGVFAVLTGLLIALPVGIYSAIRQDTVGDYITRSFAIMALAIPSFWLGILIMVLPSIWWQWSPPLKFVPFMEDPIKNLQMVIIPSIVLGLFLSGTTMRMVRTMMLEVLRQDYIRTAWAKGLRERIVIVRHALKNALIPVVSIIGLQVVLIVGGSVIIEQIFNLPGIGSLLLESLNKRDYPIVSGINLIIAVVVLLMNLVVDVTYCYLDPRVKFK